MMIYSGPADKGFSSANSQPKNRVAATAPANCAAMNKGAEVGLIPAKLSDRQRARVTAGLANEVEAVNQ